MNVPLCACAGGNANQLAVLWKGLSDTSLSVIMQCEDVLC
jgi:hypothetical protein